jgi:hypothetical protein
MDLHRRRSVLVRMTADGRKLETVRLTNSPAELLRVIARVGKTPKGCLGGHVRWALAEAISTCPPGTPLRQSSRTSSHGSRSVRYPVRLRPDVESVVVPRG